MTPADTCCSGYPACSRTWAVRTGISSGRSRRGGEQHDALPHADIDYARADGRIVDEGGLDPRGERTAGYENSIADSALSPPPR